MGALMFNVSGAVASGPWSPALEDSCQQQVRALCALAQASAEKKRAFSQLLSGILAPLDKFTRRSWLPEDEAANVTLAVIARLERENFKNLQEFVRRADLELQNGRRPSFEGWLRKLCRWEISNRLTKLSQSGLLPQDESAQGVVDTKAASQTLPLEKLIRQQRRKLEKKLLEEARGHLDERQQHAVTLYWEGKADADTDGTKREMTRALYERIKTELGLADADEARELVRGAKQKLDFWLERLAASEKQAT